MRWCGRTDRPVLPSARMKPARLVLTALVVASSALTAAAQPADVIFKDGFEAICGNEEIELGEECDGTSLGGEDCVSRVRHARLQPVLHVRHVGLLELRQRDNRDR